MTDQAPVFAIEKIYVKDASLEAPNTPQVFFEPVEPQLEIQLQSAAERISDGLFEVVVTVTITARAGERTCFLVEVAQAGIFQIRNLPESGLDPVLGVTCPNIIFPYARETAADLTARAGFPPVHLAPVNFEALYAARETERQGGQRMVAQ